MVQLLWKTTSQFLKELNIEPSISLLSIYPKEWKYMSIQNLYVNVYSSIIHNSCKSETTQVSINWWMDKIKYNISTQWDFFSAIRRNEVLIHDTTWVNLKSVMLNKRSQTWRPHTIWLCLCETSRKRWVCRIIKQISGCQRLQEGENEKWLLIGIGFFWGVMKVFWNYIVMIIWLHSFVDVLKPTELYT